MNIEAFLSADKSIVIAPAGYGKTYTIAEAIAAYRGDKKVLVLTHTHAGIASLKEKFAQKGIAAAKYHLDTICSYALNLTKTYHINKEELPDESDMKALFDFAINHATSILKAKPIRCMLAAKYEHLIVDEYQDCTEKQHRMILEIANTLRTHLLGDPLQGIFGFRAEPVVDFDDESFAPFYDHCQQLETPWRWNNVGKAALGQDLARIRQKLEAVEDVDLREYGSIFCLVGDEQDYARPQTDIRKQIFRELNRDAVIIHPMSTGVNPRKKVAQQFERYVPLQVIEPIDAKDYYEWCDAFDRLSGLPLIRSVADMMVVASSKTPVDYWINAKGELKRKSKEADVEARSGLEEITNSLCLEKSYGLIAFLINAIGKLYNVTVYRKEFVRNMVKVLVDANKLGLSAAEALVRNRNMVRRSGRALTKKSIGTTLLTKGLEFDNVVVLNAHKFDSPRHLYVALTRCCKRLVVITNNPVLHPYK
jgi:DNA helicase-2/ATP-dependent DNA helicase PcrA